MMPTDAGDEHSGDGSDEATDSEELGVVERNRRRASNSGASEESRRLFQKLWTDADEMKVLQGFYEFTSRRGTTHANYQHDTGPFFEDIRPRLHFAFNKNQIVEKLRRLKKKYRNAAARIGSARGSVFKTPHDRATYEISRNIWSSTFSRKPKNHTRPDQTCGSEEALVPVELAVTLPLHSHVIPILPSSLSEQPTPSLPPPPPAPNKKGQPLEEDALRIFLAPLFKELLHFALDGAVTTAGAVLPPVWVPPAFLAAATWREEDHRWQRQRILELELYLKRVELVEESVRSTLEKLRSMGT